MEKSGKKYKIKSYYDILDDGTAECGFNVYDVRTGDFITLIDDDYRTADIEDMDEDEFDWLIETIIY